MTTLTKQELTQVASSLMDTMFKCQDRIESTKNQYTIECNQMKIAELKALLYKVEVMMGHRVA